jgi:hypothetical protein
MNKGFLIVAGNSEDNDYVFNATVLAHSLKHTMPDCKVTLVTNENIYPEIFDTVLKFPYGDNITNRLSNDWQVYDASPYEYTIKLEADMYIPRTIDHWWDMLKNRDLFVCNTIRNHYNIVSDVKSYRRDIVQYDLPDTYNAITYFRKSSIASEFFSMVRHIFDNWELYKKEYSLFGEANTDTVYSIAATVIGPEHCIDNTLSDISMIHMKKNIVMSRDENWTHNFITEAVTGDRNILRINSSTILYPLHYYIKHYASVLYKQYYAKTYYQR